MVVPLRTFEQYILDFYDGPVLTILNSTGHLCLFIESSVAVTRPLDNALRAYFRSGSEKEKVAPLPGSDCAQILCMRTCAK